jgi:alpha-galactosidase
MQKLAMQMKELGTKPGIWMRPLLSNEKLNEAWLLSKDKFSDKFYGDIMDPSVPEVLNKIDEDIKNIISWGYDVIKHDFSTFDIFGRWGMQMNSELTNDHWSFKDTSKTSAEVISELYNTIRKAAGKTLIIGCNTVSHLSAGIFEIQRTGDDTSGREWERTRKMGINTLAFRMPQHETFYACDADCVGITKDIPWDLNKQWLELLSMSGTPLFVSADQKAVGQEQRKALQKAFQLAAQATTAAEPLDWLDTTCPKKWLIDGNIEDFSWIDMSKI